MSVVNESSVGHGIDVNTDVPHVSFLLLNVKQVSGIPLSRISIIRKLSATIVSMLQINTHMSTLHFIETQVVSPIGIALQKITEWKGLNVSMSCSLVKRDYLGKIIQQQETEKCIFVVFECEQG